MDGKAKQRPSARLIGYWSSQSDATWPDVQRFIASDWDQEERGRVVAYLRAGRGWRHYMGQSVCRLCGSRNGSAELTDGVWVWPEGLAHYVADHDVRLPEEFVRNALERGQPDPRDFPASPELDKDWWRSQQGRGG